MHRWLSEELGVHSCDAASVVLPRSEATRGRNFYPGLDVVNSVTSRYPKVFRSKLGRRSLAADALCSAQCPFNLFAPLRGTEARIVERTFSDMMAMPVSEIRDIEFEQPTRRADNPLNDKTAFDTHFRASGPHGRFQVGIEVKFTEGAYGWGRTERREMEREGSRYRSATLTGGMFKPNASNDLCNRHLKQLWRNMLLAQMLGERTGMTCYYLHVFPRGNEYQKYVVNEFRKTLTPIGDLLFRDATYEQYFEILAQHGADPVWVAWLQRRYLVST